VYRAVSGVFRNYWRGPPLHPASVSYTLAGQWGGGGSIFRKTPCRPYHDPVCSSWFIRQYTQYMTKACNGFYISILSPSRKYSIKGVQYVLTLKNIFFCWHRVQNCNQGLKDGSKAVSVHPCFHFLPKTFVIIWICRYRTVITGLLLEPPMLSELDLNENVISLDIYSTDIGKLFREPNLLILHYPVRLA
jgi:hypothetical protein